MKKIINSLNLAKYLSNFITYTNPSKKYSRSTKHQPSWMYRNE